MLVTLKDVEDLAVVAGSDLVPVLLLIHVLEVVRWWGGEVVGWLAFSKFCQENQTSSIRKRLNFSGILIH